MKIVGIEPKNFRTHVFSAFKLSRLAMPLLGTILKNKGHEVEIFLEEQGKIDENALKNADVVMISTITPTAKRAYKIAQQVKEKYKKIVIMGGPHVSFLPEEALNFADFVIRGEGEKAIVKLIEQLESTKPNFSSVPNLSYKLNGKIYHNPMDKDWIDLDTLPIPDFSLVKNFNSDKIKIYPISTSRGCPFGCIFCSVIALFGRKYRFRNKDLILEELKNIKKGQHVFFYDDNFVADKNRTKELLEDMIRHNFKGEWSTQVRIDIYKDKELLYFMKKSKCILVYVGIESINPETLKFYKKGITKKEIEEGIKTLHNFGIKIHGMFVIGADTDTKESILATLRFAKEINLDSVQFLILTPIPGTKLFEDFLNNGRIFTTDWELYDGHHVVFYPKNLSPLELQELHNTLFKDFYSYKEALKYLFKGNFWNTTIRILGKKFIKIWEKENIEFFQNLQKV